MAIDSQAKRASVLGIAQPDGTIDQGDRQTLLDVYRGILAEALSLATGLATITFSSARPSIVFSSAAPGITFSSAQPRITFSED